MCLVKILNFMKQKVKDVIVDVGNKDTKSVCVPLFKHLHINTVIELIVGIMKMIRKKSSKVTLEELLDMLRPYYLSEIIVKRSVMDGQLKEYYMPFEMKKRIPI